MSARKTYVVWKGRATGIFPDWESCARQVNGYPGAQYKAFATHLEAERALSRGYAAYAGRPASHQKWLFAPHPPQAQSYVVDAACSGSRGPVEFRGVDLRTGKLLFHQGPYQNGTNNIGEFLAIVHALRMLKDKNPGLPVYSDSHNAIGWVKAHRCKTWLKPDRSNAPLFKLIAGAERWLDEQAALNPVLKWDTRLWGENPADFNRK